MSQSPSVRLVASQPRSLRAAMRVSFSGLAVLLRFIVGGVFLSGSLVKLQQPYDFLSSVYNYELVGPQLGFWIATAVPWLELIAGLCLIFGVLDRGSWFLVIILLTIFTAAQASVASRGLLIPCGCARSPIETVGLRSVLTTSSLLLLALLGFCCSLAKSNPQRELCD